MGLTRAGHEVVRQILAAGALVDVSDASALSIDEVIDMARAWHLPVIATHSNARALADSPWNLADAQIREIAASNPLLGPSGGSDHVALGIGFESGVSSLVDLKSAADSPRLASDLRDAGMSEEDIARVFYKNALSVLCATSGVSGRNAR